MFRRDFLKLASLVALPFGRLLGRKVKPVEPPKFPDAQRLSVQWSPHAQNTGARLNIEFLDVYGNLVYPSEPRHD